MNKYSLSLALLLFCLVSCSEQDNIVPTEKRINFVFKEFDSKSKQKFDMMYEIIYNFKNPLASSSKTLEVLTANHLETGEQVYFITKKAESSNARIELQIQHGYIFDGYNCFVYGMIVTNPDTGAWIFHPASTTVQYLMNHCGYGGTA